MRLFPKRYVFGHKDNKKKVKTHLLFTKKWIFHDYF
jgi:hypothetical protein